MKRDLYIFFRFAAPDYFVISFTEYFVASNTRAMESHRERERHGSHRHAATITAEAMTYARQQNA
jgi:hypothetical protein